MPGKSTFDPNKPVPGKGQGGTPTLPNKPVPILPSTAKFVEKDDQRNAIYGYSKTQTGVVGESGELYGVAGYGPVAGVYGSSENGDGVVGSSEKYQGVYGESKENAGVVGVSSHLHGVYGLSHNPKGAGTFGTNDHGGCGVEGFCTSGRGVWGHADTGDGVVAQSKSGIGLRAGGGSLAALFEGDIQITGDIRFSNADCAEDFDISEACVESGSVMVLGDHGSLHQSQNAYDKRVAGVISGAGDYRPGIVLDKQESSAHRKPLALVGKVFCKVDAQYGAVEVGDLLTTSPTLGHAMKASDPLKAFGTVIGKALRPLAQGQALIPILVALQ